MPLPANYILSARLIVISGEPHEKDGDAPQF
jgi:hypothetical protein